MATGTEAGSGRRSGAGEMDLVVRGKRDMKPLLVKIGVAVALSFSGFIISQLRSRCRAAASGPAPRQPSSSADTETEASGITGGGLKEELRVLQSEEALENFISGTSTSTTARTTTTATTTTMVGLSPTSWSSVEESFLLPEFNELVIKEYEDSGKDMECNAHMPTPKKCGTKEESLMEQQLADLKELVLSLREREQSLEFQLLEYYGMQEKETAMRELENQLKFNSMEAKMCTLKIESLQAENQELQAQLLDHSRTMNELEVARSKIKMLKKKIKFDSEQTREKIIALNKQITMLQSMEQKEVKGDAEMEKKLKRVKELDEEVSKLRIENLRLAEENTALARQFESMKHPSSSGGAETEALWKGVNNLKEENDNLKKDIEQLQTDRCADVEELVYLRWVNACLRYELRNYQAPPGKSVARDLSMRLSPKSEEKAKQLILEYANSGAEEKTINLIDSESECFSSQASTGESEDIAYSSLGSGNPKKMKFLKKLMKLVLGNDIHSDKISAIDGTPTPSGGNSERKVSVSSCSMDDMIGRYSYHNYSSCTTDDVDPESDEQQQNKVIQSSAYFRHSFGILRPSTINMEDRDEDAELYENYNDRHKRNVSEDVRLINRILGQEETNTPEKIELKKFADALTGSRNLSESRRSASFCN